MPCPYRDKMRFLRADSKNQRQLAITSLFWRLMPERLRHVRNAFGVKILNQQDFCNWLWQMENGKWKMEKLFALSVLSLFPKGRLVHHLDHHQGRVVLGDAGF